MEYHQEKLNANHELNSTCDLNLEIKSTSIAYRGSFFMEFKKDSVPYGVTFVHELFVDKKGGDIFVTYEIINHKYADGPLQNTSWIKKNNFDKLYDLTEMGFYRGEKRKKFWGAVYNKALLQFFNAIKKDLQKEFKGTYLEKKNYLCGCEINSLYDLIVDYHLYKKNIKAHDNVYNHIMQVYPKKKWLKLNDNKFLSAILHEHGIKSKFLIKELSSSDARKKIDDPPSVNIKALIYLCNLFGENYIDYIKKFDWRKTTSEYFSKTKKHVCRNEGEKRMLVHLFKTECITDPVKINYTLESLHDLFELRKFLESHGYKKLKLKIKIVEDIHLQLECWLMLKRHLTLGYMLRYKLPDDVIMDIETPIEINGEVFKPKVLTTNDEFCIEGLVMRNCMAKQFTHGSIFMFVALSNSKKRIDLRYQGGVVNMAYAKANSPVPEDIFKEAMEILNNRMLKYKGLTWKREKYNIISES